MDSLVVGVWAAACVAGLCWLLSVVTKEYSWVDRIWSVAPPFYTALFAYGSGFECDRLLLMTALATAWGARLTFNFVRKGGYAKGGEDYRWAVLRGRMSPAAFQAFNFAFIAFYQNALIFLIVLPAFGALEHGRGVPLNALDAVAAALFVLFLIGETVADEQQWRFQKDKQARKDRGESVSAQFVTTGLFRFSRHPNFFCEQGIWWAFYLFSVAAGAGWLNVTAVGPILLTLLFQGSTAFTESITLSKYPEYASYKARVSRLLPLPPRR